MERNRYLLITTDAPLPAGRVASALGRVKARLEAGVWPIYKGTSFRDRLRPGDEVAIYVGGTHEMKGSIIATASISAVVPYADVVVTHESVSVDRPPWKVLTLDQVRYLASPVRFLEVLPRLSFCPRNMRAYGVVLVGGCKSVNAEDWNILFATT